MRLRRRGASVPTVAHRPYGYVQTTWCCSDRGASPASAPRQTAISLFCTTFERKDIKKNIKRKWSSPIIYSLIDINSHRQRISARYKIKKRSVQHHILLNHSSCIVAYAISRVLYLAETRPLSFIYDCNHSQPPATYPPTSDEQPLIVGIHGLATHEAYGPRSIATLAVGSYPAFSPLPPEGGGYFLLHYYILTNIKPLTCVVLCVARTFLPHICGSDRARMRRKDSSFFRRTQTLGAI